MKKFCFIIILLLTTRLYGQTFGAQQVKTFYYDVDNFSLTPESMKLLASFVQEVKESPIEILRIVGYVEREGGETYNKIKSKKRMENLKQSLDTALVIQQYKPLNLEFAPAFLYSYDDGFNFRRVDITYRHIYIFKNIAIDNNTLNKLSSNNSKYKKTDTTQRNSTEFKIDSNDGSVQHYQGSENENQSTIINHQNIEAQNRPPINEAGFFKRLFNKKDLYNDSNNPNQIDEEANTNLSNNNQQLNNNTSDSIINGNLANNTIKNERIINSDSTDLFDEPYLDKNFKDSTSTISNNNSIELFASDSLVENSNLNSTIDANNEENKSNDASAKQEEVNNQKSEIRDSKRRNKLKKNKKNQENYSVQKQKNYTEIKETKQTSNGEKTITIIEVKDNNQNLPISISNKSQDEIDNIVIRSRGYSKNQKVETLDEQLNRVNIKSLKENVVLITLNIQFVGNEPIITSGSLKEMTNLFVFLKSNPSVDAFIRGHVCCGHEMGLSRKRAKHVYSELIRKGIDKERLRHDGFSNTLPVVFPERNEADRRRNRRVDVILSGNNNRTIVQTFDTTVNRSQVLNIKKEKEAAEVFEDKSKNSDSKKADNKKSLTSLTVELEDDMNGLINVEGRSQVEIDFLKVRAKKSRYKQRNNKSLSLEEQLARIDVRKLDKSIFLVTLSIQFSHNKPILDDISSKELNDIFTFLYENPQLKAFIRGHVCCGNEMNLSTKRAKYIYKELIKRGIDKTRLRYQGFSNNLPLVFPERTDDDRNKNRRIDIILSK